MSARPVRNTLRALAAATMVFSFGTVSAHAAGACEKYASPSGSDAAADGSPAHPYATLRHLDAALSPGQTGCLLAGTYGDIHTWHDIATDGLPGARITIGPAPGAHVKVVGWVDIEAAYTTLSGLEIDGTNTFYDQNRPGIPCRSHGVSQGLAVNGAGDIFENNDVYQSDPTRRSVGIGIGFSGRPDNAIVRNNRIHDVGQCQAFDQIVYLASGRGVQVYGNWLWNDQHGWGVQVYPHASDAHVYDNVIDHAGSGFVLGGTSATSGNRIDHNIVLHSTGLAKANLNGVAISDYWEGRPGSGNRFTNNDSYGNPDGVARVSTAVDVAGNLTSAPRFVDAAAHDYRLQTGSPASSWGMWDGNSATATAGPATVGPPRSAGPMAHAAVLRGSRYAPRPARLLRRLARRHRLAHPHRARRPRLAGHHRHPRHRHSVRHHRARRS